LPPQSHLVIGRWLADVLEGDLSGPVSASAIAAALDVCLRPRSTGVGTLRSIHLVHSAAA
jgi:hypothetical protein